MKTQVNRHRVGANKMRCEKCEYYEVYHDINEDCGFCNRFPPSFTGADDVKISPLVYSDSWCGEYEKPAEPVFEEIVGTPEAGPNLDAIAQPEIAPCPVCGGRVIIRSRSPNIYVRCDQGGPHCVYGPERPSETEAIADWNKLAGRV